MTLKHKKLVQYVYPQAYCHRDGQSFEVFIQPLTDTHVRYRKLGEGKTAAGAWADAYSKFSVSEKKKAKRHGKA